jgi:phage repressor protein C with HTH and peptisase S24 domain
MRRNHPSEGWPLRVFRVTEDSMRPTLNPGDTLLALRGGRPRRGQLRLFPDPRMSTRWFVKRVGEVYRGERGTIFEAHSDNPEATGATDSAEFGPISAAGTYRVVWTERARRG